MIKRRSYVLIGLLTALQLGANTRADRRVFAAKPLPQPTYPVFGFVGVDSQSTKKDLGLLDAAACTSIAQRALLYTTDSPALRLVRDASRQSRSKAPVICYMGGFTTNPGGALEIEKGYRPAVAAIDVTTLATAINASTSRVTVRIPRDGQLPLVASTADWCGSNDKSKYCFWIRVDDELMKVRRVDSRSGVVEVVRGFESKAAAHAAGATVLTPVYLGNRNHPDAYRESNSWPGARDPLRYALDPAAPAAQRYKADLIVALMKQGYDGAWLDTFQPHPFNLCDALGRKVDFFYDLRGRRRYDSSAYLAALVDFLHGVRAEVRRLTGRAPYLAANSITGNYGKGAERLFSTGNDPALLDAYCFEDSYVSPEGSRSGGRKLSVLFRPVAEDRWLKNVVNQADAARRGFHALCMMGPAGYVAASIAPQLENYDQCLRFSWCSFLLTVTKERTTYFGLPLLLSPSGGKTTVLPLPKMFFARLGNPLRDDSIESLQVPGTPCYLRRFEHGVVIVNPAKKPLASMALPGRYADLETGQSLSRVSLAAGDAKLLLAQAL